MQVIYLLPFILLSFVSGLVCLAVPRWRRYIAGAIISPIAFAGCSIVGMFVSILFGEAVGLDQLLGFNQRLPIGSWRGVVTVAVFYVLPGAIGAIIAFVVATLVQRWTLHRLSFRV